MTKNGFFSGSDMDPAEMARGLRDSLSPREHAMQLLRHTLLDQQLDAIKRTIRTQEESREAERYQLDVLDTDPRWDGNYDGGLESLRDERFWQMTFQASAHSMAAVGMLAPFIESLFVSVFDGLKDKVELPPDHPRLKLKKREVWNPQVYQGSKGARCDLLQGIGQLSDVTGLAPFLPPKTQTALEAIFRYRNNMFHNGFEWPDNKICSFSDASKKWPDGWFDLARRDDKPWLFYMTPKFCAHCVALIDGIVVGTGKYLNERGL